MLTYKALDTLNKRRTVYRDNRRRILKCGDKFCF